MSQCDRILEVLTDGLPHSMREIHDRAGFMRLNSRVSELRERGHVITCDRAGGRYVYQLISSRGETDSPADDGGVPPSRPAVAAPHDPQSTNPTAEPVSPNEASSQLSLLETPRRGAYSEAA